MLLTLDTNVLYQALMSKKGASFFIFQQVRALKIQIALSVPVFAEYEAVLKREKSIRDFDLSGGDVDKFLRLIAFVGKKFQTYYLFRPNLPDENDNMLVELAIVSQSDYLVTSNLKDFNNAELIFDDLNIITPAEFVKVWRKNHG